MCATYNKKAEYYKTVAFYCDVFIRQHPLSNFPDIKAFDKGCFKRRGKILFAVPFVGDGKLFAAVCTA